MKSEKDKGKIFPADPDKTYGLMALVKGETLQVEKEPEDTVMTYPHLFLREVIAAMVLIIFMRKQPWIPRAGARGGKGYNI